MRVYLTVTYEYESVEDVANDGLPGDNALGYIREPVRTAPPVVLSGLVKGGEIRTRQDFYDMALRGPQSLFVAADGRAVNDSARGFEAAERRGALPITWYRYEEP